MVPAGQSEEMGDTYHQRLWHPSGIALRLSRARRDVPGARFWPKYFQPKRYLLIRRVGERVAWAHQRRDEKGMW